MTNLTVQVREVKLRNGLGIPTTGRRIFWQKVFLRCSKMWQEDMSGLALEKVYWIFFLFEKVWMQMWVSPLSSLHVLNVIIMKPLWETLILSLNLRSHGKKSARWKTNCLFQLHEVKEHEIKENITNPQKAVNITFFQQKYLSHIKRIYKTSTIYYPQELFPLYERAPPKKRKRNVTSIKLEQTIMFPHITFNTKPSSQVS